MTRFFGILEIDLLDAAQREITFVFIGFGDHALDRVTGAQRKLADHVGRDIDVIGTGQIVGLGATQEAEAVLKHLEHAIAADDPVFLSQFLEDGEHHVALAHRRGVLDLQLFGQREKILRALRLEISEVQAVLGHGKRSCGSPRAALVGRENGIASPGRASGRSLRRG